MKSERNTAQILIGTHNYVTPGNSASDITTGYVGVINLTDGQTEDSALSAGDKFKVVQKTTNGLIESPVIDFNSATFTNADYDDTGEVQQIDYFGYNGSANSIDVINSNGYQIVLDIYGSTMNDFARQFKKIATYKSSSSATQYEIANGLAITFKANMSRDREEDIIATVVNSASTSAGDDFDGNFVVVNGSKYATATSSGEYNATTLAVGDFVRVGASTTTAVALTSNVYRITALSGATTKTITFDRPIEEASGTYATGSNYTQVIPSATGLAADCGIKFTGQQRSFEIGYFDYDPIKWSMSISDCGTTVVTESQAASKGEGTYRAVAQLEAELKGNEAQVDYRVFPYTQPLDTYASSSANYDIINIEWVNSEEHPVGATDKSYGQLYIAIDESNGNAGLKTIFGL